MMCLFWPTCYRLVNLPSGTLNRSPNVLQMNSSTQQRDPQTLTLSRFVPSHLLTRTCQLIVIPVPQKKDELERVAKSNRWKPRCLSRIGEKYGNYGLIGSLHFSRSPPYALHMFIMLINHIQTLRCLMNTCLGFETEVIHILKFS